MSADTDRETIKAMGQQFADALVGSASEDGAYSDSARNMIMAVTVIVTGALTDQNRQADALERIAQALEDCNAAQGVPQGAANG